MPHTLETNIWIVTHCVLIECRQYEIQRNKKKRNTPGSTIRNSRTVNEQDERNNTTFNTTWLI